MQALLDEDEPLTFANSSYALHMQAQHTSSPVQVPGPHRDTSAGNLRYSKDILWLSRDKHACLSLAPHRSHSQIAAV